MNNTLDGFIAFKMHAGNLEYSSYVIATLYELLHSCGAAITTLLLFLTF